MTLLLHEFLASSADRAPESSALVVKGTQYSYAALTDQVEAVAAGLMGQGLQRLERVAIYLPKTLENVAAIFGTLRAGGVFVPVNPLLKPEQVAHILRDCNVRVLVSSESRLHQLLPVLRGCSDLRTLVVTDAAAPLDADHTLECVSWAQLIQPGAKAQPHRNIDVDMAAILYTSGSTGRPKGVVLSHRNIVTGAESVATYLENTPQDRLLAVLPLSFDYGFSQLSTAFSVGATAVLMDYLLPRDVIVAAARERVTGLAGVPPLWSQLADLEWPATLTKHLRYITNSGGAMPGATLAKLRSALPKTNVFLMYGLTEAFRSTYLPPSEVHRRPDSIGKAIPNAEILIVRPDGTPCAANEPGELVHRGSLVAMGYWNDSTKTAERFKPVPGQDPGLMLTEIAVWSGDTAYKDDEGYLYFIGRRDEMIKTSGYRVSPTEVEEVVFATGRVSDAAAIGVPHPTLGQAIVLVAAAVSGSTPDTDALMAQCQQRLPAYMVPAVIAWRDSLPRNPNGKYDRSGLYKEFAGLFASDPP